MTVCTVGEIKGAVKWEANGDEGLRTFWESNAPRKWSLAESFIVFRHNKQNVLRNFDVYFRYNGINKTSFSKRFPRTPSNDDDIAKAVEYAYQSLTEIINENHT